MKRLLTRIQSLPANLHDFLEQAHEWWATIRTVKASLAPGGFEWYPFDSLTAMPTIAGLLSPVYCEVMDSLLTEPMLDIGCADGDLSTFFGQCGVEVDAVDCAATNFNQMQGVDLLSRTLDLPVSVHNVDLDARFEFPRNQYGLTLFLGTLYHLKNPYYVLEKLAYETKWCLISTRIAQMTPRVSCRVDMEPMAYLANGIEINSDATNYWIFTAAGLLRILQRTRWAVRGVRRIGCTTDSNPIAADADERMFVLVQSRVHYPQLHVRVVAGWYADEGNSWCWTAKRFSIEVVLPLETELSGFRFRFSVPESLDENVSRPIEVSCKISGEPCGSFVCKGSGEYELVSNLPPFALHEPILQLDFEVASDFAGDGRELGICVSVTDYFDVF